MFANSNNPCLSTGTNGQSPYKAPESKSSTIPADRWKTVEVPVSSRFGALQPRDLQLLATEVAHFVVKHVNTDLLEDLHSKDCALSFAKDEASMLRQQVAELRQQMQQLQAERTPASYARQQTGGTQTPQLTANLAPITAIYGSLDAAQTAFLQEHAELVPVLLQAKHLVHEVFGENTPISLELLNANEPEAHLYLLIHTTLSYQDIAAKDKAFEAKWIAAVPHTVHSELTPTLQFD